MRSRTRTAQNAFSLDTPRSLIGRGRPAASLPVRYGTTPLPESDTAIAVAVAVVATDSRALRLTAAVGANVTLIAQLVLPGSTAVQSLAWLNELAPEPDRLMPVTVIGAEPRLVSVVFKVLLVFTGTLPKLSRVGLTTAAGSTRTVRVRVKPLAVPAIRTDVVASAGAV